MLQWLLAIATVVLLIGVGIGLWLLAVPPPPLNMTGFIKSEISVYYSGVQLGALGVDGRSLVVVQNNAGAGVNSSTVTPVWTFVNQRLINKNLAVGIAEVPEPGVTRVTARVFPANLNDQRQVLEYTNGNFYWSGWRLTLDNRNQFYWTTESNPPGVLKVNA